MKVHPVPRRCRIALRYVAASIIAQANSCRQNKLRRLPNTFTKVLELPLHCDADVSVKETPNSLRFTAATDNIEGEVRAVAVAIYPGVTKVVIRGNDVFDLLGTEFELDLWRFWLPDSTLPELVSATYFGSRLMVTVPKGVEPVDEEDDGDLGAGSRLVLV